MRVISFCHALQICLLEAVPGTTDGLTRGVCQGDIIDSPEDHPHEDLSARNTTDPDPEHWF